MGVKRGGVHAHHCRDALAQHDLWAQRERELPLNNYTSEREACEMLKHHFATCRRRRKLNNANTQTPQSSTHAP